MTNLSRPTLGASIIAKNEAENLPRLFESLKTAVDVIYFTDTGSTDNTVQVATELGAVVSHFKWCEDFSAARNFNLSQVKTDYALFIDCDDVLDNKPAFIRFRDDVMGLADYWMAPYFYSSDANGKPVCTFARERVFRTDKGFHWRYAIHEGLTPDSTIGPVRIQMTNSWAIRHMRSASDLEKDRSRNIRIFEHLKAKGVLDSRMQYYYGKELFEAGKLFDAATILKEACAKPDIELHDRILCIQYACYALMGLSQFDIASDLAQQGLKIVPHRAEFHVIMGDCFLKQGKFYEAIPSYSAARSCIVGYPPGVAAAIFHNEEAYSVYPTNQLARIYAQTGDFKQAIFYAKDSVDRWQNTESQAILDELHRVHSISVGYESAVECDDIVITCPPTGPYTWDADLAKEKSMGGSETAAIEMSTWLHKISGRPVKIFNVRDHVRTCEGVEYFPVNQLGDYMAKNKPFLHIAWRHNTKVTNAPTFLWCHDLTTPGAENHANYDRILCLTPFHKRYVMAMQGIPEEKIHVTRNGVNPDRFQDGPWEKDPFKFVFGSSPDRGLDRAMRVLDKVREKYPEVTLTVHYGIEHLTKYGLGELQTRLKQMIDERPWVNYVGASQQEELMKSYKKSSYCVQPSDWIETSMISAMELVACGVYPIMRRVGGVADTLKPFEQSGMATLVDSDCVTEMEYQVYVDSTIAALDQKAVVGVKCETQALSWESIAREWLDALPKMTGESIGVSA